MKKLAIMFLVLAAGWQICSAKTLKLGYFEIKPHMYRSHQGRAGGACIVYSEQVASHLGYEIQWVGPLPFTRMIHQLKKADKIDGTPLMSRNAERERFLHYVTIPFYHARPNFILKNDNPIDRITSPEQIRGMVVGQFHKAASSRFVMKHQDLIQFERLSTGVFLINQQMEKLLKGRIDAIHTLDAYSVFYQATARGLAGQIKIVYLPEPPWPFYTTFVKTPRGRALAQEFDRALKEMHYNPASYHLLIRAEFEALVPDSSGSN